MYCIEICATVSSGGISSHTSSLPLTSISLPHRRCAALQRGRETDLMAEKAAAVNQINSVFAEREACSITHLVSYFLLYMSSETNSAKACMLSLQQDMSSQKGFFKSEKAKKN